MNLYEPYFIYIFLPAFMGLYLITPSKKRPWLITAANLLLIAVYNNIEGLIGFAVLFLSAYFSAIPIYNCRKREEKQKLRKLLLSANILLNAAVFVLFTGRDRISLDARSGLVFFGAAVVSLHALSYLIDVYRGDCEVQTRVTVLASYMGFFPSLRFGPILKYKDFKNTLALPKISHEKLSTGISCYVGGLSVYILLASRLEDVRQTVLSFADSEIYGASVWYSALVFYVLYMIKISGLLLMGQGISLMMGFPVKRVVNSSFLCTSFRKKAYGMNIPLSRWTKDYIYKPMSGKGSAAAAVLISVLFAAMWYRFDIRLVLASIFAAAVLIIEKAFGKKTEKLSKTVKFFAAKAAVIITVMICIFPTFSDSDVFSYQAAGTDNEVFYYLFKISALPLVFGLMVVSGVVPKVVAGFNNTWFRIALSVVELILMVFCTAFVITG